MENRRHMTERLLDLTLEIIYLLTGEDCIITKKTSSNHVMPNSILSVSQRCSKKKSPRMEPLTHSLITEINNDKEILEVTQKIIELLTGEVPIRCQDVTVYFSMEEWEYLEGHQDLYKDTMMENQPPLTSSDGSSNRNTPERCPRPLYSWNSIEEHQEILQEDQGDCVSKLKTAQIEEEKCVNTVVQHKEKQIPTGGSIRKNTQQRRPNALNFRNCAQEHHKVSYDDQNECQLNMKAEDPKRVESQFLRLDVQKEPECQLNVQAEVKEKEENQISRTDVLKEKLEHRLNIKAEVPEKVEDQFLRTETQRREPLHESPLNFKAENKFLRTDVQKNEREVSVQTSISRNMQKRCPSPLYHWDSIEEHKTVLQDEKGERLLNIKVEAMESDDETYLWRDMMSKEEDVSTDGSNNRNTPERCRSPLYSWDSPLENHKFLSNYYQEERLSQRPAGGRGALEKMFGKVVEQHREEIPPEIGTDGRYTGYSMEKRPMIFPDGEMEDNVAGDSLVGIPTGANLYTVPHSMGQSSGPSTHGGNFLSRLPPVTHRTYRRRGETFMCSECGECFTAKAKLFKHQRDHIVDKPHSCPDCGKCFVEKSHLVNHQRSHSVEKPYSCSICGKCFGEKGHLANHEKSHANEKEFFCYDCGKCFTQRGHFNRHQRLHTGEKPYPCPECGKCFPHKEYLIRHQRVHAGQKPFPCPECGKCFTDKYDLAKHERIHSGHRPYSCPECGRGFTQKSNLARHVRVHADYNRIHVLTVGNGSPRDPPSSTISVPTSDERFRYRDMTAE